jgi:Xaa-Pro aminopeptidase
MAILTHQFSAAEFDRRRRQTQELAQRHGADMVLAFGENRSGVHVTYLTGWAVTRTAFVRLDGDHCELWVQFHNHVPYARRVADVSAVHDVTAQTPDDLLAGAHVVATLGSVPASVRKRAHERGVTLMSIDGDHAKLREIKSSEEIEALRLGALASDQGALGLIEACRPGATDWDLLAAARSAYTRVGGRDHICYISVADMDHPDRDVPAQVPEGRVLTQRSVVTFELSASISPEYPGQILRTVVLSEPTEDYVHMHAVAMKARSRVRESMRSGVAASELIDAADCIEAEGFTTTDDLFHGLGMGYLEPVGTSPSRVPPHRPEGILASGMSIVVQPNVTRIDHAAGVQTGEMVVVTDTGIHDLHGLEPGMVFA